MDTKYYFNNMEVPKEHWYTIKAALNNRSDVIIDNITHHIIARWH